MARKILNFGFSLVMRRPTRGRSMIPARDPGDPCSTLFHAVEGGSFVRRRSTPDGVSAPLPQFRGVTLRLVARHGFDCVTIHLARRYWLAAPQIEPHFTRFLIHWFGPFRRRGQSAAAEIAAYLFFQIIQRAGPTSSCCTRFAALLKQNLTLQSGAPSGEIKPQVVVRLRGD